MNTVLKAEPAADRMTMPVNPELFIEMVGVFRTAAERRPE